MKEFKPVFAFVSLFMGALLVGLAVSGIIASAIPAGISVVLGIILFGLGLKGLL